MRAIELSVDVTDVAGIGMAAQQAVTVHLPDVPLSDPPIVCFGFPGGGYCRRYYSFDMPDSTGGGQAGFHTERGWIFVGVDHLGFGESTVTEGNELQFENVAAGNGAVVSEVMRRLADGTLDDGFAPVVGAVTLGIGQSMGAGFTIVLQGQHGTFDGVGILGYSGIHTVVPGRPGQPTVAWPWIPRGSDLDNPRPLNASALAAAEGPMVVGKESLEAAAQAGENPFQWTFHYDDEPAEIVAADMGAIVSGAWREWHSATAPPCGIYMVAPGAVALEAASITVPVLVAVGERDVVPDPALEPKAFKSSKDISVFVCPRMGHMHNFAHTRFVFWQKIHSWGTAVADLKSLR